MIILHAIAFFSFKNCGATNLKFKTNSLLKMFIANAT